MILYHGTNLKNLENIKKEGIKPRGKRKSNWETGIGKSRPDLVYLTNCYACYYATMAVKDDKDKAVVLKLEIDPKKIELFADEEFIFRATGISQKITNTKLAIKVYESIDPTEAHLYYKDSKTNKPLSWEHSLEYMGTVTARFIPKECIIGYAVAKRDVEFLINCDPVISPLNYKFCSDSYKKYLESLNYKKI